MSSSKFTYVNPSTGVLASGSQSPDVASMAAIGEAYKQSVFSSSGSYGTAYPTPGMMDDLLDGCACRGRNNLPLGYVYATTTTTDTTIQVIMDDVTRLTMVANIPVIIAHTVDSLRNNISGEYIYRMVSAVTTTGNVVTLTVPALGVKFYKNALVIQPRVGDLDYLSLGGGEDGRVTPGVRLQLEAPGAPTISSATSTASTITASIAIATSNTWFAGYVDLYIFETLDEARRGPLPGQLPDKADTPFVSGVASPGAVGTYKGGADGYGGGSLAGTTTYYLVAVAKDRAGNFARHRSLPSAVLVKATA